ncbi:MAG: xanthine dehydrogenase small subunit [Bacteroidales bacterium]|nr:xanthine dehydrogenase small subunit [Bacteroidales bacterium]
MEKNILQFLLNDKLIEIDFLKEDFLPSTTVLNYLRMQPGFMGTKEGCAEGDCGACTVVLAEVQNGELTYKTIDSCLLFLASIHGKQLITVEHLAEINDQKIKLHPVQQAMVEHHGSQCGYCTPGFVMSMFGMYKNAAETDNEELTDAMAGNLCRCTGYKPIAEAAQACCKNPKPDKFSLQQVEIVKRLTQIRKHQSTLEISAPKQIYLLPSRLDEALGFREKYPVAVTINGATDTAIRQNKTHEFLPNILDLSAVEDIKHQKEGSAFFSLGAGTTLEQFKQFVKANFPGLMPMLKVFASLQIRNVATIGGNLSTASPIGDLIPLFFALKAEVKLSSRTDNRMIPVEEYITGYRKTSLRHDEILEAVQIPKPEKGLVFFTEKVSTRRDLDISTVSSTLRLRLNTDNFVEEIAIIYGGMAAQVKRAVAAEKYLLGKQWCFEEAERASKLICEDFTPISDARSNAEYRVAAAKNLLLKLYLKSVDNNEGLSL